MDRRAEELAEVRSAVVATLGDGPRARLEDLLATYATDAGQYEASVRSAPDGARLRGGRMMIERAPVVVVEAIGEALGIEVPPLARRLATAAAAARLPLIAGWDLGELRPCVKLYANASDASEAARRAMRDELGVSVDDDSPVAAPAVIGVNAYRGGALDLKLYAQHKSAAVLALGLGPAANALAALAVEEGSAAAGVASWDVDGDRIHPRAFFVALRDPGEGRPWRAVTELPGWNDEAVRSTIPFAPGPVRSIGVAVDDARSWTAYVKPASGDRPVHTLEPTASFRAGAAEIGVFVEPRTTSGRAYATTERYAVSVRAREGEAERETLGALLEWVIGRIERAEREGRSPDSVLSHPPAPWSRVDG